MVKTFCDVCGTELTIHNSKPSIMKDGAEIFHSPALRIYTRILLAKNGTYNALDICNTCLCDLLTTYLRNLPGVHNG